MHRGRAERVENTGRARRRCCKPVHVGDRSVLNGFLRPFCDVDRMGGLEAGEVLISS